MTQVLVSEVFGPTFQGEGPSAGRRAGFIRLGGCNLTCAWCDTPYTWDWQGKNGKAYDAAHELMPVHLSELLAQVREWQVPLVVITGGEPLLRRPAIVDLVQRLTLNHDVEIETNGTLPPPVVHSRLHYNVSPKLAGSGVHEHKRLLWGVLEQFKVLHPNMVCFKFVCTGPDDLFEVDRIVSRLGIDPGQVWIMPEGRTTNGIAAKARELAPLVLARHYNLTLRMQVALWHDQRGH